MKRTIVSNFYNEEYLLPWFLKHHREVFHHGIMINYGSTDSSCELIQELCPTWEIINTKNKYWNPIPIDQEIIEIESSIENWKTHLNVTEFMIGNYSILNENKQEQILVPNICFIDKHRNDDLTYDLPLHKQRTDGYAFWDNEGKCLDIRCARSIHKRNVNYLSETGGAGRHYLQYTTDELVIFYYGYCPFNEKGINRKLSFGAKMPPDATLGLHHKFPRDQLESIYKEQHLPLTRDLSFDIQKYINAHELTKIVL